MSNTISNLHSRLLQLSQPIAETLKRIQDTPQENNNNSKLSTKEILLSLLPNNLTNQEQNLTSPIKNLSLACALLSSSQSSTHKLLSWIPESLSILAQSAFHQISKGCQLLPIVLPELKNVIKKSSIDDDNERTDVGYAIIAGYQLRWFVTQVEKPDLGNVCNLVVPCCLTALDHWSPVVKGQGMISLIYFVKNVSSSDIGMYGDVVLDACCQNIASDDEIWVHVVELSVVLVTKLHPNTPRSPWYERMMNEMLGHLERQPRNKERCVAWLRFIEPVLDALGLFLLTHFRRIFPLFFQWMHSDDSETVLLVLERVEKIVRLTWIRNSPHFIRLVEELVSLYKESSMRKDRDVIRPLVLCILKLLQECKGQQFELAWSQYKEDPNLNTVTEYILTS